MTLPLRRLRDAAALALAVPLAACVGSDGERRTGGPEELLAPPAPPEVVASQLASVPQGKRLPLRTGERRMELEMDEPYTPTAPTGVGTDDYRCFLLDPGLEKDVWLTGSQILPGNPAVVHHVILFRVPPGRVAEAEAKDAASEDPGWTCFGGTGLAGDFANIDDAPWLAAWAPGSDESRTRDGYGARLEAGSRIIIQVHYNLLQGAQPDVSRASLRWMPGSRDLTPLHTFLMPAPVELPCRPGRDASPLCEREAALADARARFGPQEGSTADVLHLLCNSRPRPARTQSCVRYAPRGMTILGVAGHMHLLGRRITIETGPDTDEARRILDIDLWDFDDQGSRPIEPVHLDRFEPVEVTCTHQQWLRDKLPAFEGQEEKYVLWGEGTTDEMCLGVLQVAYDNE